MSDMRLSWRRMMVLGGVAFLIGSAGAASRGLAAAEPAAELRDLDLDNTIPVVLFPRREAVLSTEVSAQVTTVHKHLGDTFAKGEPLISLDSFYFVAAVEKAKAALKAAKIAYDTVRALHKRRSKSRTELARAEHEFRSLEIDLNVRQHELEACVIRAPYAGRVVKVRVHEHELVQRGDEMISLEDNRVLRARFLAPAAARVQIKIGQSVPLHVRHAQTKKVVATVTQISSANDAASRTFEVFAEIDNAAGKLSSGMVGTLHLEQIGK